ncbi:S8 family peptidase [Nostoc sp. LEGE 12450]|uniref:S8 family peptidase n=1 Tax=Nostoc sp. LEGE 12450 TaxID=1828643 RepID=UPI001D159B24|nr:S8 family serine peptidase [Nostoc sp. LEGE 12450]
MENTLDTLRNNAVVASGTHVFYTSEDEVPFVPTGQLYVICADDADPEKCQQLLEEHNLEFIEARGERKFIVQVTSESENPIKTAQSLQQSPLITVAEPDLATFGKLKVFTTPLDSLLRDQWHLRNTGFHRGTSQGFLKGADARVIDAWESSQTLGSPGVIVAVIDDGFDLSHPEFVGNGKVVAPRDFTRNSLDPQPDFLQEDWHGTACAGVAVGNANSSGIVGAAPSCRLMPVRWGRDLSDREIENWFGYVREQEAWLVSCSWGAAANYFPLSTRAFDAIAQCAREGRNGLGCVICFAAGNSNHNINDPTSRTLDGFAIHPDVIAVAACTSRDQRSNYSNYGKEISICAPSSGSGGWGITTSDVIGQYTDRNGNQREAGYSIGAYTNDFGGTSSACPLVAGICALILSIKPQLTAAQVKELIQRTARRIGDPASYDNQGHSMFYGYGCIDTASAVKALLS